MERGGGGGEEISGQRRSGFKTEEEDGEEGGGSPRSHRFVRYLLAPVFILSWDEVALPAKVVGSWEIS